LGNLPYPVCVPVGARCYFLGGNLSNLAIRSLVCMLLFASAALGQSPGSRAYIGEDVYVASGQQVHNATCIFCSVQVEGDLTGRVFVLFGSLNVTGHVAKGATVIGGNAVVDSQARIGSDLTVLGGNAVYESDDSLGGSAYVLGGHLSHVPLAHGEARAHPRLSLGPLFSILLGVVVLLLLSALLVPQIRRRVTVNQTS
jgi:UDP-3-O-[3-hydroxymyristoyl] glucosamine N-acyltransferase